MVRLIGHGGAGKSAAGALLAARMGASFLDLDRYFSERIGDISQFIERNGYDKYARQNIENYCALLGQGEQPDVLALSSGFMTYERIIILTTRAFVPRSNSAPIPSLSCHRSIARFAFLKSLGGRSPVRLAGPLRRKKRSFEHDLTSTG